MLTAVLSLLLIGAAGAPVVAESTAPVVAQPTAPVVAQSTAAGGAPGTGRPVIFVGTSGVRWDDVTETATPHLWQLLRQGATGVVAVRSVRAWACPVDGWLAIAAGRRAGDVPRPKSALCRQPGEPSRQGDTALVPGWSQLRAEAEAGSFSADPGMFAGRLDAAGVGYTAIGPGAAIALAGTDGRVAGSYLHRPRDPGELTALVESATEDSRLVVVDAGQVRDPRDLMPTDPDVKSGERAEQVRRVDAIVAAVIAGAPPTATVIVASMADSGLSPHLQLIAARGPAPPEAAITRYGPSLLGASSTRQLGMVQATDVTPTLLALLGAPAPPDMPGAVIQPQPQQLSQDARLRRLLDLDLASTSVRPLVEPFFNGLVIAQILLYGGGAVALRREWVGIEGRRRVLGILRRVAVVFSSVPIATFLANLVPWWRSDYHLTAVVGAVCIGVFAISTAALLGPWRDRLLGPLGFIGGVTAGVLAIDVATGSRLQIASLMGLQPLVAGRFYGLGNVQFALFSSGALMLACALADAALRRGRRGLATAVVVVIGVVAVIIDGTPGLGSDFGGPPAMIPAFTLMALLVAGLRVTWQRVALIAAATVGAVSALSIADWLRPPGQRTHFGRFVQTLLEGGGLQVIERKAVQNWEILTGSFLTVLLPFGAVFVGLVLMRPVAWGAPALQRTYEAAPTLRHALVALLVLVIIGFAVNDSGTVVPAIGAVLVIPLLIAASTRTLEMADRGELP